MQYVADLHLHSKYSRAVSPQMTLTVMAEYARMKGIDILTASDFTHPLWFKEISNELEEAGDGLYRIKKQEVGSKNDALFLLSTEIASIYKQGEKLRRIHNLVFAPNLETAGKISFELVKRGCNLNADGRPIIGLSSRNLLELILEIDERCFLIPCHVWTPHFGIYGSASGFDSLEEAFGEYSKYIYGVETGLSSDPDMNWSIAELRDRSILSFSDAHSPAKMGREATVFVTKNEISNDSASPAGGKFPISNFQLTYDELRLAIMRKSEKLKIGYTIEFYPEEGKYHFSGHRNCKVSYDPIQTRTKGTICPVCHKRLTEGVLVRVEQLAGAGLSDRIQIKNNQQGLKWYTDTQRMQPPYVKLVPLLEIVAESMHSTTNSQKVKDLFMKLCMELGSEVEVLLKADISDISKIGGERASIGVQKVREGNIVIVPGYDGEYGKVKIWKEGEEEKAFDDRAQLSMEL